MRNLLLCLILMALASTPGLWGQGPSSVVLVEVESLPEKGGWVVDQQFMDLMGSPYLLAHGLGVPVPDATGTVEFPGAGRYRVWVRTRDWVAPWKASGAPGRFQLLVDGKALTTTFGIEGDPWHWQDGGLVNVGKQASIALHDLTGFEGRCDALLFCLDHAYRPPDGGAQLEALRAEALGWTKEPRDGGTFDLVVIGGGVAGTTCSVAAARQGLKVALIQDRPVLGGNGSSEVRVWPEGHINLAPYPQVGDIVGEIIPPRPQGNANGLDGQYYDDARKLRLVLAEPNITLMLSHRAMRVEASGTEGLRRIHSVMAQQVESGRRVQVRAKFFADGTGDGVIGALAGADYEVMPKGNMGSSNLWSVAAVAQNEPQLKCLCKDLDPWSFDFMKSDKEQPFPRCPWAIDMAELSFPGRKGATGQWGERKGALGNLGTWFWESGSGKHPIHDMEWVRDYNLRAMYGAWDALKNVDKLYPKQRLKWSAFIAGKRESRRLLGDVILSADHFRKDTQWPDPAFPCTWHIDIHHPHEDFTDPSLPEPFIAKATDSKAHHYQGPYWAPYRCLYSRNVQNLFMAGRDVSCTHDGLGAIRVMRTCGMMGEAVARAAWIAVRYETTPRGVYESYLPTLRKLMKQPGGMRRRAIDGDLIAPPGVKIVHRQGLDLKDMRGIVIDDSEALLSGSWNRDGKLLGFVGVGYQYSWDAKAQATYPITVKTAGEYDVYVNWLAHPNRAPKAGLSLSLSTGGVVRHTTLDQRQPPGEGQRFRHLGRYAFEPEAGASLVITNEGKQGALHIDALQLIPVH